MVDQSYIEEIKRRNAERAAKLKESLKMGDFSKLAPGGTGEEPLGAVQVSPAVAQPAEPPPPPASTPVSAGPPPPPPDRGVSTQATPPPPPASSAAQAAQPAPPPVRAEEPVAVEPPAEEAETPVIPSDGIWDEILGETVSAAPEEMPSPLDSGPSTSELEEFKVPLFDSSRIEEEAPVAEEEAVSAVSDHEEGITDEFNVPAFDSGSSGDTTAVIEETVEEEPVAPPVVYPPPAAAEPEEEFVVPAFDSSTEEIEEIEEIEEVAEPEEELAVPTFDSAPVETGEPIPSTDEYLVPALDSSVPTPVPAEEEFAVPDIPVPEAPVAEPVSSTPSSVADNFIILEVQGTELRLRRRNITLREAVSIFEVAADECKKLLEE